MVENAVFLGCSSLLALTYSSLTDVQKFITRRPFIISGSVNNHWKAEKLPYVFLFMLQPDSGRSTVKLENYVDCTVRTEFTIIFWLLLSYHLYQCLSFPYC
jgi:hypothetical protein